MNVKILLAMLSGILGKTFAPETNEEDLIKAVDTALKEKDATIGELETKVKGLESLAEEGKAYRKELVNEYVRMKAALDECDETPEAADGLKAFAKAMGITFLKTEVKHLQARMEKKFPDKEQLKGDMRQDKSNESDNPLIPKEEQ